MPGEVKRAAPFRKLLARNVVLSTMNSGGVCVGAVRVGEAKETIVSVGREK